MEIFSDNGKGIAFSSSVPYYVALASQGTKYLDAYNVGGSGSASSVQHPGLLFLEDPHFIDHVPKYKRNSKLHLIMDGVSATQQVNSRSGPDSYLEFLTGKSFQLGFGNHPGLGGPPVRSHFESMFSSSNREYAMRTLELYEKSQGSKFEIKEVLYLERSWLIVPGSLAESSGSVTPINFSAQECIHVSFTAKPRNAYFSVVSPQHFFGELKKDERERIFMAKNCFTFEPTDDPGFNHGCVFCPADQKFHPADGYKIGRPPCYVPEKCWK